MAHPVHVIEEHLLYESEDHALLEYVASPLSPPAKEVRRWSWCPFIPQVGHNGLFGGHSKTTFHARGHRHNIGEGNLDDQLVNEQLDREVSARVESRCVSPELGVG